MNPSLSDEEADGFFAVVFRGINHAPKRRRDAAHTVSVSVYAPCGLSTYDYDELTRFVLLCHERCYRGAVSQSAPRHIRLSITKRSRESDRIEANHPTIEEAVAHMRSGSERQWVPQRKDEQGEVHEHMGAVEFPGGEARKLDPPVTLDDLAALRRDAVRDALLAVAEAAEVANTGHGSATAYTIASVLRARAGQ